VSLREVRGDITKELTINEEIRASEVRVIGETGENLGTMSLDKALQIARDRDLDLVEVAPTARPPVCRLLDYGRYKYHQAKKERESRKHHKVSTLREVRMRVAISEHDLEGKTKVVKKLLEEGDKVRIAVMFRGREITRPELAWKILQKVSTSLKEYAHVEKLPSMEGRFMSVILAPKTPKSAREPKGTADAKAKNP
jgi:translation initiation factor IF-3